MREPRSFCPHCQKTIQARDNIPILSFIILKGKCRYCQQKIAWRYPLVELTTALIFLFTFLSFGVSWITLTSVFFCSILIILAFIDIDFKIIPNGVILTGLIAGIFFILLELIFKISFLSTKGTILTKFLSSLYGLFIAGSFFFIITLFFPKGMGGGDIKLAALIGLFLGWQKTIVGLFSGIIIGGIFAVILLAFRLKGRKDPIPFGPFLVLGGLIGLFLGEQLFNLYINMFK